jgi:hypothetical protein
MTYNSNRPADDVAKCISEGWQRAPALGTYRAPVEKLESGYYITPEPMGSPVLASDCYRFYDAICAEVSESTTGSVTHYHRNFIVAFPERFSRVVRECQDAAGQRTPANPPGR